ncbi:hypothetical protein B0A55_10853 [Friedmanniomyces simplex]|uniref:DDE-1 domain-containing protein n=1 Tax=Friedmanniomyces simplex TaxID=329884 RepID=A0A4U0X612_9PEZI|nr:hypothetical protein B0A55_10853 [Friedmanniomyces simplex]
MSFLNVVYLQRRPWLSTFVEDVVGKRSGKGWCQRFSKKWSHLLLSRYLLPLDSEHRKVDSRSEYEYWFTLLEKKIAQYAVLPENIYNMDDKGFLIEYLTKAKRIVSRAAFESKRLLGNMQDVITKRKARNGRDYRLLIVDGHGSHINMRFLDVCLADRILVAVPLGIKYSQELDKFMHNCQGFCNVTKRDFFGPFWPAYTAAFTESKIKSGWSRTGLWPLQPEVILSIFKEPQAAASALIRLSTGSSTSTVSNSDWRKMEKLVAGVVGQAFDQEEQKKVKRLRDQILTITTENAILKAQNKGYQAALNNEKKRRKRCKNVFETIRGNDGHGATFFSPMRIQTAKEDMALR